MDNDVVVAHSNRRSRNAWSVGRFAQQCVDHTLWNIHRRRTVAEFICARRWKFDSTIWVRNTIVSTATRCLQTSENCREKRSLIQPHCLWSDLPSTFWSSCKAGVFCEPLQKFVHTLLRIAQRIHLFLWGELLKSIHINDRRLRVLESFAKLPEKSFDFFQFSFDFHCMRNIERFSTSESPP